MHAIPFRFAHGDHYHPDALRAFELQRQRAEAMGQRWSEAHANAFRELHDAYVKTAYGIHQGRTAWPLAVGTGKTQSLVAFAKVQSERRDPLSLLVCIERVDHAVALRQEMLDGGVPEDMIGVYHKKTDAEIRAEGLVPSLTDAAIDRTPFVIATHALMLKGEDHISRVNTYLGKPRRLIVWDESLIKSQGLYLSLRDVDEALATFAVAVDYADGEHKDAQDALAYLTECKDRLHADFKRALAGAEPRTADLPRITPEDETRFRVAIAAELRGENHTKARKTLLELLDHVQRPVRVVPYRDTTNRRLGGAVRFLTHIPEHLNNLIVLDASHNIRRLVSEHDTTLRVTDVDCRVKSFETVKVTHYVQAAGRDALDKQLPRKDSLATQRVLSVLAGIPRDEAALIVTFLPRDRKNIKRGKANAKRGETNADHIKQQMVAAGMNPDERLPDGRPRFVFITWGQHIGTNAYGYVKHVLCVGVMRRDALDIVASIAGQRGHLLTPAASDDEEVRNTVLSEMFHNVIQAAGRGACRNTTDGKAHPMTLTLLCSEVFPPEWWAEAMPGAVVTVVDAAADREEAREAAKRSILEALAGLPDHHQWISKQALKGLAGLEGMRPDTYSRLLKAMIAEGVPGWVSEGKRFRRASPFQRVASP